jgi:hypothetical protein
MEADEPKLENRLQTGAQPAAIPFFDHQSVVRIIANNNYNNIR